MSWNILRGKASVPQYSLKTGAAVVFCGAAAASSVLYAFTMQNPISFLFFVLAASLTVFLRLAVPSPLMYLTALPAFLAGFLTNGVFAAFAAVLWLPCAAAASVIILRGMNKKQATLAAVFALVAAACLLFAVWFACTNGSLSPALLRETISGWFDRLREVMFDEESVDLLYDYLAPAFDETFTKQMFSAQMASLVDSFFLSLKMMTPAIIGLAALFASYITVSLAALWVKVMNCPLLLPCRPFEVTVSPAAATVYVLSYFASTAAAVAEETRISLGLNNLVLLFMPAMLLMGCKALLRLAKNPLRRRTFFVIILFLFLMFWNGLALYLVSLLGVFDCFRSVYRNRLKK